MDCSSQEFLLPEKNCITDSTAMQEAAECDARLYKAIMSRAVQDLICATNKVFGKKDGATKLNFDVSCPEMSEIDFDLLVRWFRSESTETHSFVWLCGEVGVEPSVCLRSVRKTMRSQFKEEIL